MLHDCNEHGCELYCTMMLWMSGTLIVYEWHPHAWITCGVVWCPHCDVVDEWHPHVWMSLETEGEDGSADEEDWDDSHSLKHLFVVRSEGE